jgi:uncharacterized protein (UPF0333 family)
VVVLIIDFVFLVVLVVLLVVMAIIFFAGSNLLPSYGKIRTNEAPQAIFFV